MVVGGLSNQVGGWQGTESVVVGTLKGGKGKIGGGNVKQT